MLHARPSKSARPLGRLAAVVAAALLSAVLAQSGASTPDRGYAEVNGARIFYKAEGAGEPMLLIHGYPLNGELFKRNRAALARNYRVITVDLRNFGLSSAPTSEATIATYAQDVLGVMDELDIEEAIVGGMSMGGITLFEMWRRAPTRIKGMVLIDTTADPAPPAEAAMWRGHADQAAARGVASLNPLLLPNMLTGKTRTARPGDATFLGNLVKQASVKGAVGGGNALANRPDSVPTLATITVPALIVVGLEDSLTPYETAYKMNRGIKGSRLVTIPGAAHAANFEAAAATNRAIASWASSVR